MLDLRRRLAQLRSFIWWSVPLYAVFLLAGAYASQYAWTPEVALLAGVLGAYAALDAIALQRIHAMEDGALASLAEFEALRARVDRLARFLVRAGIAFAALFAVLLAVLILT